MIGNDAEMVQESFQLGHAGSRRHLCGFIVKGGHYLRRGNAVQRQRPNTAVGADGTSKATDHGFRVAIGALGTALTIPRTVRAVAEKGSLAGAEATTTPRTDQRWTAYRRQRRPRCRPSWAVNKSSSATCADRQQREERLHLIQYAALWRDHQYYT